MGYLTVLVAMLIMSIAPAVAQPFYTCTMPDGRMVLTNAPCAGANNETVPFRDHAIDQQDRTRPKAQLSPAAQPANLSCEGCVTEVVDTQMLKILCDGKSVLMCVRDIRSATTKDDVLKLVEQQTVTAYIASRIPDGTFIGEVILSTGQSLSQALTGSVLWLLPDRMTRAPATTFASRPAAPSPSPRAWDCSSHRSEHCADTIPDLPGVRIEDIPFTTE